MIKITNKRVNYSEGQVEVPTGISAEDVKSYPRVRFAPSPTGPIHFGNLRVAIANWLYARQNNGKFYVRFEDTDTVRSDKKYEEDILNILSWVEIKPEKDIWRQSERTEIYDFYLNKLVESGKTYYCQCKNSEETDLASLKNEKYKQHQCDCRGENFTSGAVRFIVPKDQELTFDDMVIGKITVNSNTIECFVLRRSDGTYTYNFTVVVDDGDRGITHVIRGSDHISNTPKQMCIYNALKLKHPIFAHLPMIDSENGVKFSKRLGTGNVLRYKDEEGIVADALFAYLSTFGGGVGDHEPRTREEIEKVFDITKISKSPGSFDEKKLLAFCREYLGKNPQKYFFALFVFFRDQDKGYRCTSAGDFLRLKELLPEFAKRASTLKELAKDLTFVYEDLPINKEFLKELDKDTLQKVIRYLGDVDDTDPELNTELFYISGNKWNEEHLSAIFKTHFSDNLAKVCNILRIAILNTHASPSIFLVITHLGKKDTLRKLQLAVDIL